MPRTISSPREQLKTLRPALLELHRMLLDAERRHYEGAHGRVAPAELLQLALRHEQFAWLHQISAVIVRVDELISSAEAPSTSEVGVVSSHLRLLLKPSPEGADFARQYDRAIQEDPAVLLAHRAVMQTLPPEPEPGPETIH
jgi:hypothetical protein